MKAFYNVIIFLAYALFSGSGLIILKMALSEKPFNWENILGIFLSTRFLIGFSLYAAGFLVWMFILSKFRLNVAYPVSVSLFFAATLLGSYFILREQISSLQGIGIIICLLGILLISTK